MSVNGILLGQNTNNNNLDASQAEGATRNLFLESNINDTANKAALGEFTEYDNTYGLGYALALYGKVTNVQEFNELSKCQNRQEIIRNDKAIKIIKNNDKIKQLWNKYLFMVKGKYYEKKELVGDTPITGTIIQNPKNMFLYLYPYEGAVYVSQDLGQTWHLMGGRIGTGKLVFSSDYKYVYCYDYSSRASLKDYIYVSYDGITFGNSILYGYSGMRSSNQKGIIKCGEKYYYAYNEDYTSYIYTWNENDSFLDQSQIISKNFTNEINQYPVGRGGVFVTTSGFCTIFNDTFKEYDLLAAKSETPLCQYDVEGNFYIQLSSSESETQYYKITLSGEVIKLQNKENFPFPSVLNNIGHNYSLYSNLPYNAFVSLEGKLITNSFSDNNSLADLVFPTSNLAFVSNNKINGWEVSSEKKLYKVTGYLEK